MDILQEVTGSALYAAQVEDDMERSIIRTTS